MVSFGSASLGWWFLPFVIFGVLGVLMLLTRWTFSPAKRAPAQPPRFGLLETLAEYPTAEKAEVTAHRLRVQGIKASTGHHGGKHYLLVWRNQSELGKVALARIDGPGKA
ncbi:hypothetical protein [Solicola sp. PLA-1-18]|uniref:hypothetical protein n=1 Tax=Solicola sp. PLA-1-18 TaxID=3380532 RepID=UPI003B75DEB0